MLTEAQAAELQMLRARVYGPAAEVDAATLARLSQLEGARADGPSPVEASDDEAVVSPGASAAQPAPTDAAPPPRRRGRTRAALLIAAVAIFAFAGGVVVGAVTSDTRRSLPDDINTGIPDSAAQTLERVRTLQTWDEDTLRFVGSIRQVTVWVGSVRNGRSVCAVFDRPGGAAGDSTQLDCRPTLSENDYPIQLQWVREFSGLSEIYAVILRESGETQLSYSTT